MEIGIKENYFLIDNQVEVTLPEQIIDKVNSKKDIYRILTEHCKCKWNSLFWEYRSILPSKLLCMPY